MAPTIKAGERVSIDHTAYALTSPKRWDVIPFRPPAFSNSAFVMRVVGMPGETVAFARGGISVNGQTLILPPGLTNVTYLSMDQLAPHVRAGAIPSPYVVPKNSYFVLGDNSANANDSRYLGAVSKTNVLGRVRNK